ncbi:helix-turn-helix domain-containing protein [Iodobacter sp. LRB]|uniref:GlxA family transcriptional regulator n=1 Tax=unclassified Iodobacter TaxID=235634 RepID=UPI000C0CC883|nr:helix-turn-helix domain-containing protein [Iodobacter sp. BJB302]PHV01431.1 AraC family transcriptional regulator [Iodobacter sp. BJB302]
MKRIFFVLLPHVHILDLGGPMQILGTLPELGLAELSIHCVGPHTGLNSFQGVSLMDIAPLPAKLIKGDVVVMVGSKIQTDQPYTPHQLKVVDWLSALGRNMPEGVIIASVCTGALFLAEAGLLNGRYCTTHHDYLERLQKAAPASRVLSKRLMVQDGPVYTSAGVSAGIDLALHLVGQYFGSAVALRVARENLVQFRRLEHDPELSAPLCYRNHNDPVIHLVQDYMTQHPCDSGTYDELAEQFSLSYRHLARLFQQACGITLKQYQQKLKLDLARRMLKDSHRSIEGIIEHCGFASPQAFRAAWRQAETLSPSVWRKVQKLDRAHEAA